MPDNDSDFERLLQRHCGSLSDKNRKILKKYLKKSPFRTLVF